MTGQKDKKGHIYERLLIEPYLYTKTFFVFLFRPRKAFTYMIKGEQKFSYPAIFLTINTVLSLLIIYLFRSEIPKAPDGWPFIKIGNLGNNLSFSIIRLLVGFCLFLVLMRCFTKNKDNFVNFILKAFPVLCYCSLLYIPVVTLHEIYRYSLSKDFAVPLLSFLLQQPVRIDLGVVYKYLFLFFLLLVFLLWWFLLLHLGMKSQQIQISKKAIFMSLLLFVIIKISIGTSFSTYRNWDIIKSYYIIWTQKVDKELSKTPPTYTKAFILASQVSENKKLPPYIRYVYKLKRVSYYMAIRLRTEEEDLVNKLLHGLHGRKYDNVRKLIIKRISIMNNKQELWFNYDKELKEINELSQSDIYKGELIGFGIGILIGPDKVLYEKGNKSITILLPLYLNLISLFPSYIEL